MKQCRKRINLEKGNNVHSYSYHINCGIYTGKCLSPERSGIIGKSRDYNDYCCLVVCVCGGGVGAGGGAGRGRGNGGRNQGSFGYGCAARRFKTHPIHILGL